MKDKSVTFKKYMTTSELMSFLSCSRSTIDRMVKSKKINKYRLNSIQKSKIFYRLSEVENLFKPVN
jgi:predicted DNA-binding transcriptional regulator AlpA